MKYSVKQQAYDIASDANLDQTRLGLTLLDVLSLMKSSRGNFTNIAEAIQFDPSSTKRLLGKVNSPLFALENPVRDLQHAVSILGVSKLRDLLINSTSSSFYHQFVKLESFLMEIKKHSIAVACYASQLAKQNRRYYPKEFYQAGLQHDIGRYVLTFSMGSEYLKLVQEAESMNYSLHLHERDQIGYDHTEIGVIAAGNWKIPENIITCIQFHHELSDENRERLTSRQTDLVESISFANLMTQSHSTSARRSQYRTYLSDLPTPPGEMSVQDLKLVGERANTDYQEIIRSLGLI